MPVEISAKPNITQSSISIVILGGVKDSLFIDKNISSENRSIIIDSDLERWYFNSYSRGYHAYINIWIPLIRDESLICRKENDNEYDPDTVAITRNNVLVRRVPQNICGYFWKFLSLSRTSIRPRVLGKRVNRGAGYSL